MSGLADLVKSAGSGARGAKFPDVGAIVGGPVLSVDIVPNRDDDGEALFWDDGKPQQKVRIIVQTEEDDGVDDQGREDDGRRAIYIKWWGEQRKKLIEALVKAGAEDVEVSGTFYAKYEAEGERAKRSWNPQKIMRYKYKAPANLPPKDEFDDEDEAPAAKKAAPAAKQTAKPAAKRVAPEKQAAKPAAKKTAKRPVDLDDADEPLDSKAALKDAGLDDDDF